MNAEGTGPASFSEALSSCVVSLYNPILQKSVQFRGNCGCFIPPSKLNRSWCAAVYVSTTTGSGEHIHIVDLDHVEAKQRSNGNSQDTPKQEEETQILTLSECESPLLKCSSSIPVLHRYLGVFPPVAVPGSMIASYESNGLSRLVHLSCTGQLNIVDSVTAAVVDSASICDDLIISSSFDNGRTLPNREDGAITPASVVFLTSAKSKLLRVIPDILSSKEV